jgi:hypothetical protein
MVGIDPDATSSSYELKDRLRGGERRWSTLTFDFHLRLGSFDSMEDPSLAVAYSRKTFQDATTILLHGTACIEPGQILNLPEFTLMVGLSWLFGWFLALYSC